MNRIWLCAVHQSTGRLQALLWSVAEAGQSETVAQQPPGEHQRGDGGKAAGEADPDADTLPVGREREPGANAEADHPIADQSEHEPPSPVLEGPPHSRA